MMADRVPTQANLHAPQHVALDVRDQKHYLSRNASPRGQEPLDVRFRTRKLQRICNSKEGLERHFGDMAGVIMNRLQVLAMANHLGQVPRTKPMRRHQLSGARRGQFAVDLLHPYRLVFRPDHNPIPEKPDGGVDVNAVIAIEIIEIIDYH